MKNTRFSLPRVLALVVCAAIFFVSAYLLADFNDNKENLTDSLRYDPAIVRAILADNAAADDSADGGWRGEQQLTAELVGGPFAGQTVTVYNFIGPLYSAPLAVDARCVLTLSCRDGAIVQATVYEPDRSLPLLLIVLLFVAVVVLVGGRTGLRSLLGLLFALACVLLLLFPALMKGAPTLPVTFAVCLFMALVTFLLISDNRQKTVGAFLGTLAGTACALLFGLLSQSLLGVSGLRLADAEALLQLRQTGEAPLRLSGLLLGGVVISSLGAVMDVAMSISSALTEIHSIDPSRSRRELFASGMTIGKDMVGTMTNTLILALLGGSFSFLLYLYSLRLSFHQLLSSAYLSTELISAVASSIGMICAIPCTALLTALLLSARRKAHTVPERKDS